MLNLKNKIKIIININIPLSIIVNNYIISIFNWSVLFQDSQWEFRSRSCTWNRNVSVLNIDKAEIMSFLIYTFFLKWWYLHEFYQAYQNSKHISQFLRLLIKHDLLVCSCFELHALISVIICCILIILSFKGCLM